MAPCKICAFLPGQPHLAWLAKVAGDPLGKRRLRREHEALRYLQPWAGQLGIPELVAWEEEAGRSCLIQGGIPGSALFYGVPHDLDEAGIKRRFQPPLEWLERFGATVPLPQPESEWSVADRHIRVVEQREDLGAARIGLVEVLRASRPAASRPALAVHGDFWVHNILYSGSRIAVCDWDGFGAGTPLQDFFSLMVNCDYYGRGQVYTMPGKYAHVCFSDSIVSRWAQRQVEKFACTAEELRFYFYCFFATQLHRYKGGIPVESLRSVLAVLAACGFPGPWTLSSRQLLGGRPGERADGADLGGKDG
jgi:hypothetical protein